jgi:hypothetical protein
MLFLRLGGDEITREMRGRWGDRAKDDVRCAIDQKWHEEMALLSTAQILF